ncbi:DUF1150 family protein [Oceanomicrobium pacificus]|uniref:DUF1150 family protein n=1 Tax=Oceanomicrobium pacificus TaxID=2692916 RepID=A0A6B0TTB8_9RHOB|nr:DUF1150 family protein [Oceanomicrobium pacificus]MXU64223.1 DUF1150 family protein [Oceanomicrobium pacificus]
MTDFATDTGRLADRIVYVRVADNELIPDELKPVSESQTLYTIHDSVGTQLAIVSDRSEAFRVARFNDMMPVSVH